MPARIQRLRPRHPKGGAVTITYPTMGQQQFMVEPPSTSPMFPDFAAALSSHSCLTESSEMPSATALNLLLLLSFPTP